MVSLRASANNFRDQDIASRTHGVGEGEEDQDGGEGSSKFQSKAKICMKKTSIPEAVLNLRVGACRSRPFVPPLFGQ